MKKILQKLSLFIFGVILSFTSITPLFAASATISVSSSSKVTIGTTFSVTFKVSSGSALGTWEFTPSYDTSKLKLTSGSKSVVDYGNGSLKSKSYTYKFKAIGTGSAKISVKSYGVIDYKTESKMSVSVSSKTVTIISESQKKASYSSNNNLKSLSIDGLSLTPSFSKNTTSYKATADSNTTKINLKAAVEDAKAKLAGVGTKEVNEGQNKFEITVTAENGSKKTYTVIVDVVDPNPIEVTIDEEKYVVVKREKSIPTLENYKLDKIKIDEQEVPCLYNEINNYFLVALKDKDSKINLYLYDTVNKKYKLYEDAALDQLNILPLEIENDYKKDNPRIQITIDNIKFNAIKLNANGLYILKARNLNDGKDNYYEYDEQTNTLIRYVEDTSKDEELLKYKKMMVILSIETVVVILVLISILIHKMRKNKKRKKKIEEEKIRQEQIQEKENTKKKKNEKKKEVKDDEKENKNN